MSAEGSVILGIDPGTAILGVAVLRSGARGPELVYCGAITTPARQPQPQRLLTLFHGLQDVMSRFEPTEVAVERLFFARNVTTALTVGEARGVAILAASLAALPVSEYTPLQIKRAIGGYGRATKDQVGEMVRLVLGLPTVPQPDDVADAVAVAVCHISTAQNGDAIAAASSPSPSGRGSG